MSLFHLFKKPTENLFNPTTQDVSKKKVATLTPREREAYLLLLEGYTLRRCAEQMGVKYPTVNTYATSIYRKLGVRSRTELIIQYRDIR